MSLLKARDCCFSASGGELLKAVPPETRPLKDVGMWLCQAKGSLNSRKEGCSQKFKLGQRDKYRNCSGSDICSKGTVGMVGLWKFM